jgi:dephospho-CoA kinase
MIVAITGNIGSGKTEVCRIFQEEGWHLIDADKVGHRLYLRPDMKEGVIERFGDGILTEGEIDRKKLKAIVFYNPGELKALNKIMHPEIIKEIRKEIAGIKDKHVILEGAILIEMGEHDFDKLLLVTVEKGKQMERLLKKGKYNKEELNNILKSQMPQEEKIKYADYIVDNSGTLDELEKNVKRIIAELK